MIRSSLQEGEEQLPATWMMASKFWFGRRDGFEIVKL
jgi:hypothetical protein